LGVVTECAVLSTMRAPPSIVRCTGLRNGGEGYDGERSRQQVCSVLTVLRLQLTRYTQQTLIVMVGCAEPYAGCRGG
jgi:hypothetical protein